jgi:hypothetical protein
VLRVGLDARLAQVVDRDLLVGAVAAQARLVMKKTSTSAARAASIIRAAPRIGIATLLRIQSKCPKRV